MSKIAEYSAAIKAAIKAKFEKVEEEKLTAESKIQVCYRHAQLVADVDDAKRGRNKAESLLDERSDFNPDVFARLLSEDGTRLELLCAQGAEMSFLAQHKKAILASFDRVVVKAAQEKLAQFENENLAVLAEAGIITGS